MTSFSCLESCSFVINATLQLVPLMILKDNWSRCSAAVDEILRICKIWHKHKSSRWLKLGGCWVSVEGLVLWWLFVFCCGLSDFLCVVSATVHTFLQLLSWGCSEYREKLRLNDNVRLYFNLRFIQFFVVILLFHPPTLALKLSCSIQALKITPQTILNS